MITTKLYKVEFNKYTSWSNDCVFNELEDIYLNIPLGGLVIKEYEFERYSKFGDGFKSLTFIGTLLEGE